MSKINFKNKKNAAFIGLLLSSVALQVLPAKADAELDALQDRLEKAQKENLTLKAEKLEQENLAMNAEILEQENSRLRAEAGNARREASTTKTVAPTEGQRPVARNVAPVKPGMSASAPFRHVASYDEEAHSRRLEKIRADRAINEALDNIPKNDSRRDMTAAAHVVPEATTGRIVSTVSPVVQQWGGVYAGINAGYGKGDFATTSTQLSANGLIVNDSGQNIDGPVVGGQIGYNYQFVNKVVAGVEADMDYADVRISGYPNSSTTNISISSGASSAYNFNISARTGVNWLGTVRARLGYAIGNFMPYFTGGLAYGNTSIDTNYTSLSSQYYGPPNWTAQTNNYGTVVSGVFGNVQAGWAAGAGAEFKVADNWSLRGEYLYTSIGGLPATSTIYNYSRQTYNGSTTSDNQTPSLANSSMGSIGIHQARVGLNYYTGWGASAPTVTAKYSDVGQFCNIRKRLS